MRSSEYASGATNSHMRTRTLAILLLTGQLFCFLPEPLSGQQAYYPPSANAGGWRTLVSPNTDATPGQKTAVLEETGLDWDRLNDAWLYARRFVGRDSIMVIRRGWIVAEWSTSPRPMAIASCTKSLTAVAMAKLFDLSDSGRFATTIGIDDYAYRYLPASWAAEEAERKSIKIRHLMTMSSGLDAYDGPYGDLDAYAETVVTRRVVAPPGEVWEYSSAPVDLLSQIIEKVTGKTQRDFFNQEIGAAIGGQEVTWPSYQGHTGSSGGPGLGARYTARELARVAYLLLQKGIWNEGNGPKQIVSAQQVSMLSQPAEFLKNSTFRTSVFVKDPRAPNYYGYLFWTNRTQQALGPKVPKDTFFMSGLGKQACWIIPSLDMVIVRIGLKPRLDRLPDYFPEFLSRVMSAVVAE